MANVVHLTFIYIKAEGVQTRCGINARPLRCEGVASEIIIAATEKDGAEIKLSGDQPFVTCKRCLRFVVAEEERSKRVNQDVS